MHPFLAFALGFALENAKRELAENNEPCKESCDEGHDSHCDEQDSSGKYSLSCDMHPTTGCDANCHYPPPPPRDPWMGMAGTYPSPPPPPPPPHEEILIAAWIYFVVALLILCLVLLCFCYRRGGESRDLVAFWCCCLVPAQWFGERRSRWEGGGVEMEEREKAMPPALLLSER